MSGIDHSLIAGFALFKDFSTEQMKSVLKGARSIRYPANQNVFEQDSAAHSFFFLLHGHLRVAKMTPDGRQVVVRYVNPGDLFGIAQAMGRATYPATSTAVVDSIALVWPSSSWPNLTEQYPAFVTNAMHAVGRRLQEAHGKVVGLATQTADRRIAHVLLDLVQKTGRESALGTEISFPLSRQDVAEMTGTTLHTVSRLLSAWEEQGIVKSRRRKIAVSNWSALKAIAEKGE